MGYGRLKKMVQGKDTMDEKQSFPCRRWCHGPLLFLHQFLRFVLLLLLHHSGKITTPMIICYFFSRFCTSSSSSLCSAKASWASMDISTLSSGGIETAIVDYHSWWELIYHFFGTYLLQSIFDRQFQKICPPHAATMRRGLHHYRWQVKTFQYIGLCHWAHRWCAM